MLFVLYCLDHPGKKDIRSATRGAHLEYIEVSGDLVRAAGPLIADDGETMVGSLFVVEAANKAKAELWNRNDPYMKAGLFQHVEVRQWKWLIGAPASLAAKS